MEIVTREHALSNGLVRYFTGKPCKRGHISERRTKSRGCYRRDAIRVNGWNKANRAKTRGNNQKWRERHPETVKRLLQNWYVANREKAKADNKAWQQAHPEMMREYDRRRREKDPEKAAHRLSRLAQYAEASRHNRRSKMKSDGGKIPSAVLLVIRDRAKGRCANCGKRRKLEFDHIHPIAKGGRHVPRNLQMLCRPCNQDKLAKDPIVWARQNGKLV